MPPQNRLWRNNRGHLTQRGTPETMSERRQPTPVVIREPQPSAAQLGPQDPILFHQIPDHVLLLLTQPAGEGGEEELKRGHVNHGGASLPTDDVHASGDASAEFWDTTGSCSQECEDRRQYALR